MSTWSGLARCMPMDSATRQCGSAGRFPQARLTNLMPASSTDYIFSIEWAMNELTRNDAKPFVCLHLASLALMAGCGWLVQYMASPLFYHKGRVRHSIDPSDPCHPADLSSVSNQPLSIVVHVPSHTARLSVAILHGIPTGDNPATKPST